MKKLFWFDVESTGLDPKINDIIQLAYIIEIDNKIEVEGEFKVQPFDYTTIEKSALEVNNTTIEQLKTYTKPLVIHQKIISLLDSFIDKYNREDKFIPAGYNVKFDMGMLENFFEKANHKFFGSYFFRHSLDPMHFLSFLEYKGLIELENFKLGTVCKHFGIDLESHDALSDIKATRELTLRLMDYLKEKPDENL